MSSLTLEHFVSDSCEVQDKTRDLHHLFEEADCYALWAAYQAQRPLLLRGAPGTGKSQIAKAIAHRLGWAFVSEVIHGNTELSDLYWQFDAVARLSEAQVQSAEPPEMRQERLKASHYVSPGSFWWAYDWSSAQHFYTHCKTSRRPAPYQPTGWNPEKDGVVLLLDEIDKADPDLPNGLLETLGNLEFTVPYLNQLNVHSSSGDSNHDSKKPMPSTEKNLAGLTCDGLMQAKPQKLLIVITTNEERELPSAFVRRCFVHALSMPRDNTEEWLIKRGYLHFGDRIEAQAYELAAAMLMNNRRSQTTFRPGLAEYIDLLRVVKDLDKPLQMERLKKVATYVMEKGKTE